MDTQRVRSVFIMAGLLLAVNSYGQLGGKVWDCHLVSENYMGSSDTLDFRMSDPGLPNPVIIGANGAAPLEQITMAPDENMLFLLAFRERQGHVYFFFRYAQEPSIPGSVMRAAHWRWGNSDNEFLGFCKPV